jgi:uncharacterized protein YyaL (SSP411 family)
MRTVTFSDRRVAEAVNSGFVPVWYNRGRGFHNCEVRTEKWIFESSGEAYPTKNICTFFLTPDLKVVHYAAGYYAPEVFLDVLAAARRMEGVADAAEFARLHRERQGRAERECGAALRWRGQEHRHSRGCAAVVKEAEAYFRRVHGALAESGPVPLETVQHAYLFGNSFTEEVDAEPPPREAVARPKTPTR